VGGKPDKGTKEAKRVLIRLMMSRPPQETKRLKTKRGGRMEGRNRMETVNTGEKMFQGR